MKDYEVTEGTISSIYKNDDFNCLMIELSLPPFTQGFPACRTKGGYEEQIKHLKEVFDVEDEKELLGMNFIALNCITSIFCLYNPKNNNFFSTQAKFFPEQYKDSLDEIKEIYKSEFSQFKEINDFNQLMIGVILSQKNQTPEMLNLKNAVLNNQLKE